MRNDLKGIEIYFELTGGLSYRGFELPRVDCGCTTTYVHCKQFFVRLSKKKSATC